MMKFQAASKNTKLARRPAMVRNSAGGYSFKVEDWKQLERFLMLGTTGGTFYIGEDALTSVNLDAIERCLDVDAERVVRTVVDVSHSGKAVSNDPALMVLAMAAARKQVRMIAPKDGRSAFSVEEPTDGSRLALASLLKVARIFTISATS
nr:hypothetical protein Hi04_10k_c2089_00028 [uncultured bacterium]